MADETPEPSVPPHDAAPELPHRLRTPPTLDLEASRVDDDSVEPDPLEPDAPAADDVSEPPSPEAVRPAAIRRGALLSGAAGGAVTALVVVGAAWWLGGRGANTALDRPTVATLETLGARLNRLETAPAARPNPALTARLDDVEKSVAGLREALDTVRARNEGLGQSIAALAAAHETPAKEPAPATDTAPAAAASDAAAATEARLAQLDTTLKSLTDDVASLRAAQAKQDQAISAEPQRAAAQDQPLRHAVAAVALELAVRQGAPFATELAAARRTGTDASALAPLQPFADKGLPDAAALARELVALLPKETAPAVESSSHAGGWWERLEAGAARLIRIRRIDAADEPDAEATGLPRVAAAARRGDLAGADAALAALPEGVRAPFQPWRETLAARDAALAAARRLAAESTSALSKPSAPQAPQ